MGQANADNGRDRGRSKQTAAKCTSREGGKHVQQNRVVNMTWYEVCNKRPVNTLILIMARVDSARSARRAVRWKRETPRDEKTRAVNYRGWHMRLVSGQNRRSVVERSLRTVLQRTSAGSRGRTPLFANSLRWCPVFSSQPTRPLFLAGCHPIIIETSPSKPALAIAQRHDEARDQRKKAISSAQPIFRIDSDDPI